MTEEFAAAFANAFDTLEFSSGKIIDILSIVDQIEDIGDDRIRVNFDKDLTWCSIAVHGIIGTITITPDSVKIVQPKPTSPRSVVESFFDFQKKLVNSYQLNQLRFDNSNE